MNDAVLKFVIVPQLLWEKQLKQWEELPSTSSNTYDLPRKTPKITPKIENKNNVDNVSGANNQYERILQRVSKSKAVISKKVVLLDKLVANPRISFSEDDEIIVDGVNTNEPIVSFLDEIFHKKTQIPDIFLTILEMLKIPDQFVLNQNAQQEDRGDWIPFRR